ncbi:methylmalonyl-CoA mutase family protein [Lapillicoccus jejuensis]|uniref:Heterodimeric methylmalonyl-CoA mutase small subunit n=1 Tax=Lapillicoccus jejuensis TaxID=402171 RepID=A0A542E1L4_9MICO|nr:methylmalonyl-CoA mutase family protein [Lapillicoccus jejuensis]TQJ09227.1 heterodimeric methylmalonyl-CoA mutase small subunit [Lapillicoccus jejuensis]
MSENDGDAAEPVAEEVRGGLDERADLEPAQGSLALADGATATREQWEHAAAGVLRKAGRLTDDDADALVWEKLARRTLDGLTVTPLGTPDDLDGLVTGGRPQRVGAWDVRALLSVGDDVAPAAAREEALADLEGGVTSLWLRVAPDTDLPALLDGVLLDVAPVVLDAPGSALDTARAFVDHLRATGVTAAAGTSLGADPVAARVRGVDVSLDALVEIARLARDAGVEAAIVDATALHDRGATQAQELGYSLAVGLAYLRALEAEVGLDDAGRLLSFRYAATDEQFPTIALLRAARRLWARVLEHCGAAPAPQRQHAVTSRPMLSAYDVHVNLLRTTVAAFAAGVGGADAVTVLPYDEPIGRADAFSRRMARNQSALLLDESHVGAVADPAGGAYAVERLTDDLARAGWAELQRIEAAGGVLAALDDGSLLARVDDSVAARDRLVATRRRPVTGLSEFPDLAERRPTRSPDRLAPPVRRYGAPYEALRDDPPSATVFLATLGPVAQHTARATFASNLLAAGGIGVDVAGATADAGEVAAAYGGQPVVLVAGTDDAYAQWGADAARALRDKGARWVVVAGKPAGWADDSCAMGVDALAFLSRTREKLGDDRPGDERPVHTREEARA